MAKSTSIVDTSNEDNMHSEVKVKPAVIEPNKIGLVNRKDCNIVVTLTDGNSTVLAPKQRTDKEFLRERIKSVNGKPLSLATNEVMIIN